MVTTASPTEMSEAEEKSEGAAEKAKRILAEKLAGAGAKFHEADVFLSNSLGDKLSGFAKFALKSVGLQASGIIGQGLVGIDGAKDIWAAFSDKDRGLSERVALGGKGVLKGAAAATLLQGLAPTIDKILPVKRAGQMK